MESASFLPPHFRALYTVFCTTARGHCAPCSPCTEKPRSFVRGWRDESSARGGRAEDTKFRKCHDRLQRLTKRRYSWFDKRSPLLAIANINLLYWPLGKERGVLTWNYTWGDLVTLMLAFDIKEIWWMTIKFLYDQSRQSIKFLIIMYIILRTGCPGIRKNNCKVK